MNINPQVTQPTIATTVNPPTDSLRRENVQREVISQTTAPSYSAAEKGVATEKERVRTPAQNVEEGIDFAAIQEQAELENSTISERQPGQQQSEQNASSGSQQVADENGEENEDANANNDQSSERSTSERQQSANPNELTPQEQQLVQELRARDLEVRAHEQAHDTVGGRYTGAPQLEYETGPDGKRYAVEGEVSVDLSIPDSPEETVAKMRKVYQAALAPANPSAQDLRVANKASQAIADAQSEISRARLSESVEENDLSKPLGGGGPQITSLDELESQTSSEFDAQIAATIAAQEQITAEPSRADEINQRAERVETFYLAINQAYDPPAKNNFVIQA